MSSFLHNLFNNFSFNNSNYNYNQQPYHESLLGAGPKDWLSNAAVFAGADYLLNRYDENNDNQVHYWRNAGLAGALALGFQYYKNNHHPAQQQQQYYYPQYNYGYQDQYYNPYYGNNMMYTTPYAQPMGPQLMTYPQQQMAPYYPSYMY